MLSCTCVMQLFYHGSEYYQSWYYGTNPTSRSGQLSFSTDNATHCPTQTVGPNHGQGDWGGVTSLSISCAPPTPPSPPPSPDAPPPAAYDGHCPCNTFTVFCSPDIGHKSRCTDYTLVLPDPQVARHDSRPVFASADESNFLMWDKNND